jgi:PAS domain S-box-containing protein
LVAVALMTGVRFILDPMLGQQPTFITFFFAILFAAWYGGFGPSVAATLLSCLSVVYFSFLPHYSHVTMGMFVAVCSAIIAFSEANRAAHRRLERKIADRNLAERERQRFVSLAQNSGEFIGMCDMQGIPFFVNDAGMRLVGLDGLEEAVHTPVKEFFFPEDQGFITGKFFPRVLKDGHGEVEIRFRHFKTGEALWMICNVFVLQDADAQPAGFATVSRDITRRKQAEQALRDSERLYRAIGESIDYGVWVCNPEGRNVYASDSFLRLVGLTQQQCSEFGWGKVLHPDDTERTIAAWEKCVCTEGIWDIEHRFKGVDGEYHPVLARGIPVLDEQGRVTCWAGINLDISRLKRAEQELLEADRRKDEFLAMLAHELRNPLAPIYNAVSIMAIAKDDPETQRWSRELIDRQVRHLAKLVDDLLDVSRNTQGKITLTKAPLAISTFINAAVESSRPLIDARKHRLEVSLSKDTLRVEGDPTRLAQIVVNLLNNAAKYTPEGGHIHLSACREGNQAAIRVRDDGEGIPHDMLGKVFDLFTQASRSMDRSQGGLGIGLTLVRRLVEMHGGTIEVHSDGPTKGSEFLVRLPLIPIAKVLPDPKGMSDVGNAKRERSRRILIVDDSRDSVDTLARLLTRLGHEIETAHDGLSACETAVTFTPDLVLLDIGLPGMDGFEVARRLRAESSLDGVYLVALTGYGSESDRNRSKESGFDAHLVKPVEIDALLAILDKTKVGPSSEPSVQ